MKKIFLFLGLLSSWHFCFAQNLAKGVHVEDASGFWTAGPIIALAVGCVGLLLSVFLFIKITSLKKEIDIIKAQVSKDLNKKLKLIDESNKKELGQLKSQIEEIKSKNNDLALKISSLSEPKRPHENIPISNEVKATTQELKHVGNEKADELVKHIMYFGPPRNNHFAGGRSAFTPGQSIYVMEDKGNGIMEFKFSDRKEALSVALRSISDYIESACIIVGNPSSNPTKVVTLKPGILKREGNDWIIENKTQINLI